MAQLALGIVGGVVGGFFGGPQGAMAGFAIGSMLGGLIDPPKGPHTDQVGPRLSDLKIGNGQYGVPIIYMVGEMRMAGNLIWAKNIKEVVTTTETDSGGKGGPSSSNTSTTYTYFGRFAVGICEGPDATIEKIWGNGKLIYDASTGYDKYGCFTFYPGSETQTADPFIESFEGVGNIPAYRGICYAVANDIPLADFGNSNPNLEFLVCRLATTPAPPPPTANAIGFQNADIHGVGLDIPNGFTGRGIFSTWFRPCDPFNVSTPGVFIQYPNANNTLYREIVISSGALEISDGFANFRNYASDILPAELTSGVDTSTWHHFLVAWDFATDTVQFYLDGVSRRNAAADTTSGTYPRNFTYDGTDIVRFFGSQLMLAAQTWLGPGQSLSAISQFYTGPTALNLGADGSVPTGTPPSVYLDGNASTYPANRGTGGTTAVFTITFGGTFQPAPGGLVDGLPFTAPYDPY